MLEFEALHLPIESLFKNFVSDMAIYNTPTMQVISVGILTKIQVNNLPHPLPPQAGGGGLRSNCALKNNYSRTKLCFCDFM